MMMDVANNAAHSCKPMLGSALVHTQSHLQPSGAIACTDIISGPWKCQNRQFCNLVQPRGTADTAMILCERSMVSHHHAQFRNTAKRAKCGNDVGSAEGGVQAAEGGGAPTSSLLSRVLRSFSSASCLNCRSSSGGLRGCIHIQHDVRNVPRTSKHKVKSETMRNQSLAKPHLPI